MAAVFNMLLTFIAGIFLAGLPSIILMMILVDSKRIFNVTQYMVYYCRVYGIKSLLGGLMRRKQRFFEESARVEVLTGMLGDAGRKRVERITVILFFLLFAYAALPVLLMSKIIAFLE